MSRPGRHGLRRDPVVIKASKAGIDRHHVSAGALKTVEGLQKAGFQAFVVGGAVRDLLLGLRPKDFDVATNADPETVQRLFRRARLIGRRFQIVHVMQGGETIEVSTFRALAHANQETDRHGRVLRDNTFGEQHEDAARRDFTINALYYDPVHDEVLDYHNGVKDLKARVIRMIGDPAQRYREDPVRMLRVVRFMSKLDFKVDPATLAPIPELAGLLSNVPSARLFDEMVKLLTSGAAFRGLEQLQALGLHNDCLPLVDMALSPPGDAQSRARSVQLLQNALAKTDARVREGRPVSVGFLFGVLLWAPVNQRWQVLQARGERFVPALQQAIDEVIERELDRLAIQRRMVSDLREVWMMQPRFERRSASHAARLMEHLRFRHAYDFLLLRGEVGEVDASLADWWQAYVEGDDESRADLIDSLTRGESAPANTGPRRKRRRGPRSRPSANGLSGSGSQEG